jgi:hypothetical protein
VGNLGSEDSDSVVGDGKGSSVGNGDWSVGNGLNDSWGLTVDDGVESVDWISGVGNGTDGTIGLNKGVLSLDNISVTGLGGGLGVSGEGIRNGVSVVVLWMWVIWLWGSDDSLGNSEWLSDSAEDGLGNLTDQLGLSEKLGLGEELGLSTEKGLGKANSSISWGSDANGGRAISDWADDSSSSHGGKSENNEDLHIDAYVTDTEVLFKLYC